MPQPPPEVHNPEYLKNLTAIIGGLIAVLLTLIAFITNGFKKTQEGQQDQLDEGTVEFTNLKLKVQHLEDALQSQHEWVVALEKDFDNDHVTLKDLHEWRIRLNIKHKQMHGEDI